MKKIVYLCVILNMFLLFGCAPSKKGSSPSSKGELFESYVKGKITSTKIDIRDPEDNLKEYTSEEDINAILDKLEQTSFQKEIRPLSAGCNHGYSVEIYDQEEMVMWVYLMGEYLGEYYCRLHIEPPFQGEKYKEEEQSLKEGEEIFYKIDKNLDSYIRELFQAKDGN